MKGPKRGSPRKLIFPVLLLIGLLACAAYFYFIPEYRYQKACSLIDQGKYDAASQAFRELGDYKDAPEMVLGVYYTEAEVLLAQGDRAGAIAAFEKAGDHSNAADRIDAIQYQNATALLNAGKEDEAYALFRSILHYQDAREQARAIRVHQAARAMEVEDYAGAAAIYIALGEDEKAPIHAWAKELFGKKEYASAAHAWQFIIGYADSQDCIYRCAMAASNQRDYALSTDLFTYLADYKDSKNLLQADAYAWGVLLMEEGDYQKALSLFDGLGDFENAPLMAMECRYCLALEDLNSGRYAQAKAAFMALGSYQDSEQLVREADYRSGMAAMVTGDYATAMDIFLSLQDYQDSADYLLLARYRLAQDLMVRGDYDGAIVLFMMLDHYEDSAAMLLQSYYGKALFLSNRGDTQGAYEYFLLAKDWADAPQLALDQAFTHAMNLHLQGDYEGALLWYDRAGSNPEIQQQRFLIGEIYFSLQEYSKALDVFRLCASQEGAGEYLYAIGQHYESQHDVISAYAAYVYAENHMPSQECRLLLAPQVQALADQAFRQGQFAAADNIYALLYRGGTITEEALLAEFFAFLTQPDRKFTLGVYPQGADGAVAPVIWRFIENNGQRIILLADQPLDCVQYTSRTTADAEAFLRDLPAFFNAMEQLAIEKIYLPSQQQLKKYLPGAADRICQPTEYARSKSIPEGTYRTEGVWTATASDAFNCVIYNPQTGVMGHASLTFKTNYVRPALEVQLNAALHQLLTAPENGYFFYDETGASVAFLSRYQ